MSHFEYRVDGNINIQLINGYYRISGLQRKHTQEYFDNVFPWRKGDEPVWQDFPVSFRYSYLEGFGCGVAGSITSVAAILEMGELWEIPQVAEAFHNALRPISQRSSFIICATDDQLSGAQAQKTLEIWKKRWIVHECGSFPNYTHGPNNMNFIVLNFNKDLYPVTWDKEHKREKARLAVEKRRSIISTIVRDARGRFAKRADTGATGNQRLLF